MFQNCLYTLKNVFQNCLYNARCPSLTLKTTRIKFREFDVWNIINYFEMNVEQITISASVFDITKRDTVASCQRDDKILLLA